MMGLTQIDRRPEVLGKPDQKALYTCKEISKKKFNKTLVP